MNQELINTQVFRGTKAFQGNDKDLQKTARCSHLTQDEKEEWAERETLQISILNSGNRDFHCW